MYKNYDMLNNNPLYRRLGETGPGAHTASYTMGTASLCSGVKRPGRGVDHLPPSSAAVKERIELYICSPSGPSWPVIGRPLPLINNADVR